MKTAVKLATGVLVFLFMFTIVLPVIPYKTRVSYYDFVNGQYRGYSTTLGIKYGNGNGPTQYGTLVEKLKLQDEPVWYKTSARIYYQRGSSGYNLVRAVVTDFNSFSSWADMGMVDNLTTEIRGIQAVARKGNARELGSYMFEVKKRIVSNLPEDEH